MPEDARKPPQKTHGLVTDQRKKANDRDPSECDLRPANPASSIQHPVTNPLFCAHLFLEIITQVFAPQLIFGLDGLMKRPRIGVGAFSGHHHRKTGM